MEGGLYEWEDILEAMANGSMQSFSDGQSFVLTRIVDYPRKRVLEILLLVGTVEEIHATEPRVIQFAQDHGCEAIIGYGRLGWEGVMPDGWRKVFSFYIKELKK